MPNTFAYLMLMVWPVVMAVLFRKLSPDRALIWSFLGAFTLLPTGVYFDFPLIPTLDKYTLPSVAAMVLCLTMVKQKIRIFPASRLATVLMLGILFSPFATVLNNPEPVFWGIGIPGLSFYDAISEVMKHGILLIPFILGFNLLSTQQARRTVLTAYMFAGLVYSVPMLLEIRLSPQFNNWVYGFFPQLFGQQVRFGGFRPVVFMGHGLTVAFFALMTVMAAATLWRGSRTDRRALYPAALAWLLVVLVLCKTVGAILFAVAFVPIILFTGPRIKGWAILFCATFVLTYPVLRAADVIPVDRMVEYAAMIQDDRGQSLEFRFTNEKLLLDHAARKPVFGWGYWGRNRIYDRETGRDLSVTDGYWVIIIGVLGWTGYISVFGLLTLPLFRLWYHRRSDRSTGDGHLAYGIALMLGANMLDLIPNSTINPLTWALAGLLLASTVKNAQADPEAETIEDGAPTVIFHQRRPRNARSADMTQATFRPSQRMQR